MSFRSINLTGLSPVVPAGQAQPILQWVDLDHLVIDDRYQRPLGPRNMAAIQKIAAEFDWMQFAPVLLAPADGGRFAIIDGQHRSHAAALCGFTRVPAQIVMASAAQQARAFAGVNGKVTPITAHQVYRAALAAGEPWAQRCCAVVESAGCVLATVHPSSKDRKPGVIYQVGTVRRMIVDRGQAEQLRQVLTAIVAYDSKGRVGLYSDYIVRPLVEALASDQTLARLDLLAFLQRNDPFQILDRAQKARAAGGSVSDMAALRRALAQFEVAA